MPVIDSPTFEVSSNDGETKSVPCLDSVITHDPTCNRLGIVVVNLHEKDTIKCRINGLKNLKFDRNYMYSLASDSVNAFNSVDHPDAVTIEERNFQNVEWENFDYSASLPFSFNN